MPYFLDGDDPYGGVNRGASIMRGIRDRRGMGILGLGFPGVSLEQLEQIATTQQPFEYRNLPEYANYYDEALGKMTRRQKRDPQTRAVVKKRQGMYKVQDKYGKVHETSADALMNTINAMRKFKNRLSIIKAGLEPLKQKYPLALQKNPEKNPLKTLERQKYNAAKQRFWEWYYTQFPPPDPALKEARKRGPRKRLTHMGFDKMMERLDKPNMTQNWFRSYYTRPTKFSDEFINKWVDFTAPEDSYDEEEEAWKNAIQTKLMGMPKGNYMRYWVNDFKNSEKPMPDIPDELLPPEPKYILNPKYTGEIGKRNRALRYANVEFDRGALDQGILDAGRAKENALQAFTWDNKPYPLRSYYGPDNNLVIPRSYSRQDKDALFSNDTYTLAQSRYDDAKKGNQIRMPPPYKSIKGARPVNDVDLPGAYDDNMDDDD